MALKVYNTLTRKKEEFKPIKGKTVRFYSCGVTPYSIAHLGHGRSAVAFDIIRKYLKHKGYSVKYVSNYTDIDDKLIQRAQKEKTTVKALAEKNILQYKKDYALLSIDIPDKTPRATAYIKEMIDLIKTLEKKGYVYVIKGDGVYYDATKFKDYGKLSRQNLEDLKAGARIDLGKKHHPSDFVLWKFKKIGEPHWKAPWGDGRPGWHIECSAMVFSTLGKTIDIHGGGQDLIFPHHEDEIAQSEAASGKPFAKYWMHNGLITVDKEKMSKSLGNFFTLKDVLEKYDGKVIRYLFLSTLYRHPIDFSEKLLEQSKNSLQRIHDFVRNLENYEGKEPDPKITTLLAKAEKNFEKGMDDDFETPKAMTAIYELIREVNSLLGKGNMSKGDAGKVLKTLRKFDTVLGILEEKITIPKEIQTLVNKREAARKAKNWTESDKLRDEIKKRGYNLDDASSGTIVKKR